MDYDEYMRMMQDRVLESMSQDWDRSEDGDPDEEKVLGSRDAEGLLEEASALLAVWLVENDMDRERVVRVLDAAMDMLDRNLMELVKGGRNR